MTCLALHLIILGSVDNCAVTPCILLSSYPSDCCRKYRSKPALLRPSQSALDRATVSSLLTAGPIISLDTDTLQSRAKRKGSDQSDITGDMTSDNDGDMAHLMKLSVI